MLRQHKLYVQLQLDKAINRPGADRNEEMMTAMRETLDANAFLMKLDHLPMAVMALTRNRESLARATATCSNKFDRMMKAHAVVPSSGVVEELLAAPPKGFVLPDLPCTEMFPSLRTKLMISVVQIGLMLLRFSSVVEKTMSKCCQKS